MIKTKVMNSKVRKVVNLNGKLYMIKNKVICEQSDKLHYRQIFNEELIKILKKKFLN